MLQVKNIATRIISGVLTASMALSLVQTGVVPAEATPASGKVQAKGITSSRTESLTPREITQSLESGPDEIPMPLSFDRTWIGFMEELGEQEVNAVMTDLQYLGVLSLEEYASFFPIGLDLDRVEYLTRSQRRYIASMSEEQRMAHRAEAEAKIMVKEQFESFYEYKEKDYSDKIAVEPVKWIVHDATLSAPPSMECTFKVTWIGEKPVNYVDAPSTSLDEAQNLLNGGNKDGVGTKSVYDESPEVRELLRQMYLEGGLTQENSPYYTISRSWATAAAST